MRRELTLRLHNENSWKVWNLITAFIKSTAFYGTKISASEAKPGDLFFYGGGRSISHVAIYIGNGQIVHASNKRDGIKVSNAYYRNPICVARYLPD